MVKMIQHVQVKSATSALLEIRLLGAAATEDRRGIFWAIGATMGNGEGILEEMLRGRRIPSGNLT